MDNKPHTIQWSDEFSVNVKEIDDQHKTFVETLNSLYQSAVALAPRSTIKEIINTLVEYGAMHFATEEKYFDKYKYPFAEEHKEQHKKLTAHLLEFKDKFDKGEDVAFDLLDFLEDWLVGHLANYDMQYSKFFNDNGLF